MKRFISLISILVAMTAISVSCSQSASDVDVEGVWSLVSIDGTVVDLGEDQPVIAFKDGAYHANTGVNIANGDYTVSGNTLTIKEGMMTKMAGSEEAMAIEVRLMQIASTSLDASVEGDVLTLTAFDGATIEFQRSEE